MASSTVLPSGLRSQTILVRLSALTWAVVPTVSALLWAVPPNPGEFDSGTEAAIGPILAWYLWIASFTVLGLGCVAWAVLRPRERNAVRGSAAMLSGAAALAAFILWLPAIRSGAHTSTPVATTLGLAVLVLPPISMWLLGRDREQG